MIFMNAGHYLGRVPAAASQSGEWDNVVGKRQGQWDIELARVEATLHSGTNVIGFDIAGSNGHEVRQGDESPQDRRDGLGPITVTRRIW